MAIRDILARRNAGGPQFRFIPNRVVVELGDGQSISDLAQSQQEQFYNILDSRPVGSTLMDRVDKQLQSLNFDTKRLDNTGVIVAETDRVASVVNNLRNLEDEVSTRTRKRLGQLESRAKSGTSGTIIDAFRPGLFNFSQSEDNQLEANLRNELLGGMQNPITEAIAEFDGVVNAELGYTYNTPGPRNLGIDPLDTARDITPGILADEGKPDLGDVQEKIGVKSAWQVDTGEGAVVAIFDTSFCKELVDSDRVIDTFSGEGVDSAYSAPDEGHGTMTAYSAGGNVDDTKGNDEAPELNYSGVAKDSELLLARLSDSSGGMVYVVEAWDWLADWVKTLDKPVISNHSYGIPLCNGRTMDLCNSTQTSIAVAMSKRDDHQAIYAAGNEGTYCGHRLSGATNGITGVNSRAENLAVAAFRFDRDDAQTYSSHGFGSCGSRLDNPKPDFGCMLPTIVPYGCKEKDMSTQNGGSGAGTSEAAPITAGVAALVASITGTARQSVIEGILESTANRVRRTQVNLIRGHDARFGHGQVRADKAVQQAEILESQEAPKATFTFRPANPTLGDEVTFDASGSTDENEDIESYEWSFGNGETATGQQVTHTFEEPGPHSVVLVVTDSVDLEARATSEVYVNSEPEAAFSASTTSPTTSMTVTFDATASSDRDDDIQNYLWDFGDGTTAQGQVVEHQYGESGNYTATLQVEDGVGNIDSTATTLNVTAAPEPQFTYEPETPISGATVEFDATASTDPNDDIESYTWEFGDGTVSNGAVATHSYDIFGEVEVTLTVEDSAGNTESVSQMIEVQAAPRPDFTVTPAAPTTSDAVEFDASQSADPDDQIVGYQWDFGDMQSGEGEVVEHMFVDPSQYEVMLTTTDAAGNSESITQTVEVSDTVGDSTSDDVTDGETATRVE